MKYCCMGCRYTYDEALGDPSEWIEAGTDFFSMQDYFVCPVCGEGPDSFEIEKEDVLYAEDKFNLDPLERQHIPHIEILWDTAIVKIWVDQHPMIEEHYIISIGLYDDYGDLVEEEFLSPDTSNELHFDISSFDSFEVRAKCNLHGIWGNKIERE